RRLVRGMAHVYTEYVDACEEQALDHFRCRRGRAKGRDDLDHSFASHFSLASGSVRRMVHSCDSPVSASKKPVRLKPRCWQSWTPRMANDLSSVHMKLVPTHSPPRS